MCIMSSIRFNITLPRDIGLKVKASKNHSALIAESLREKFEREEKEHLSKELAEGYAATAKEDAKINAEFDHMVGDGID